MASNFTMKTPGHKLKHDGCHLKKKKHNIYTRLSIVFKHISIGYKLWKSLPKNSCSHLLVEPLPETLVRDKTKPEAGDHHVAQLQRLGLLSYMT